MNDLVRFLANDLNRASLVMVAVGVAVWLLLRLSRVTSPTLHRTACVLTLLVGWTVLQVPVAVPWYEAKPVSLPTPATSAPVSTAVVAKHDLSPPLRRFEIDALTETSISTESVPVSVEVAPIRRPVRKPATGNTIQHSPIDWKKVAAGVWLAGLVSLVVAWITAYLWFLLRLPRGLNAPPEWNDQWIALQQSAGVPTSIPLRVTKSVGPLLCRLPRGYELLVPETFWSELDEAARAAILRHELAHYQRADVWKSLGVRLLMLPHWFNPVAWLAVWHFDEAAEWAADRAAAGDDSQVDYAKLLVELGARRQPVMGLGSAFRRHSLAARIRRLITGANREDSRIRKSLVGMGLVGLLTLAVVRVDLVAQTAPSRPFKPTKTETTVKPPRTETTQTGPTVSPYLNLLQEPSTPVAGEELTQATRERETAAEKMVKAAEYAYRASKAALDTGTTTIDVVPAWSQRWLNAELTIAKKFADKILAAEHHLARMKELQEKTDALYKIGNAGGEAKEKGTAEYFVAQAELQLAEIKQQAAQVEHLRKPVPPPAVPAPVPAPLEKADQTDRMPRGKESVVAPALEMSAEEQAAAEQMVKDAAETYEAVVAAYGQGAVTLDPVHAWSQRWCLAELNAAKNAAEQLAAADRNLQRAIGIQKKIRALYDAGMQGGEAKDMRAANYYVAQAQKQLAEVAKRVKAAENTKPSARYGRGNSGLPALEPQTSNIPLRNPPLQLTLRQTAPGEFQLYQGDSPTDEQKLQAWLADYGDIREKPTTLLSADRTIPYGEVEKVIDMLSKLGLHKLSLDIPSKSPAQDPSLPAQAEQSDQSDRAPRYKFRTLGNWLEMLETEIEPEAQLRALKALRQFAANGQGSAVSQAVLNAMQAYSSWSLDAAADPELAKLVEAAYESVAAGGTQSESSVLDQLKSGNKNQRLFCVMVLPQVTDGPQAAVSHLLTATADPEPRVRMLARQLAALIDHDSPEVLAALRVGLESSNQDEVIASIHMVYGLNMHGNASPSGGLPMSRPFWKLHPDVILLLDDRAHEPGFFKAMDAMAEQLGQDQDRSSKLVEQEEKLQFAAWEEEAKSASGDRLRRFLSITEEVAKDANPEKAKPINDLLSQLRERVKAEEASNLIEQMRDANGPIKTP